MGDAKMNLLHMKYAVEVAKTESISKAAENLFMGQPNLSRAIKELEESLGIIIFERSTKGIRVTEAGQEFLQHARRILSQVDEIEALYRDGQRQKQKFSVCVPRTSYIAEAFAELAVQIDNAQSAEFFYKETNPMSTINDVCNGDYNLGIVRYQEAFEPYFMQSFTDKNLICEPIATFTFSLLLSERSPLAQKENICAKDLRGGIEILYGDQFIPSLPSATIKRAQHSDFTDKQIYVFERFSPFTLLNEIPNAFMQVPPIPQKMLDTYHLVQRPVLADKIYKDVLVFRKDYTLSSLDKRFIESLRKKSVQLF